jgi:hypothetical protein
VALEAQTGCPGALLVAQWAIESEWGAKPTGREEARRTKWCTVTTLEVFTPVQLETWNHQHAASPARVIATLPDGRQRVEIDDEFADYDSLDTSCQDYAWLITHGTPYRGAWLQAQMKDDSAAAEIALVRQFIAWKDEILQLLNSKYMTAVLVAEIRDGIAHDVSRIDKVLDRLDRRREEWLHFPPGCGAPA